MILNYERAFETADDTVFVDSRSGGVEWSGKRMGQKMRGRAILTKT